MKTRSVRVEARDALDHMDLPADIIRSDRQAASPSPAPTHVGAGPFGSSREGGGREAGFEVWRAYMRRSTNTINSGAALPLAQGVTFEIFGGVVS